VRVLCDQAGSPGHAKAPIVLLPASATIRRGLLMRGVAEPAVHVLRPSIDLGRVRHQRRAALRERWQLDDDTPLIALISDPPEAADALEAVHSAGLVGEAMKRPVSLLVLPQQAGRWRAEQLLGPIPAPRYGHVQEPLADQPWAVLPGCDVALGIGPGAGGLSLLWAMAANVPIVAEATYAVSEIVEDRHSALLSTPGAGFALAHRITRLLEENRLAWELRDTARHEAFSLFSRRRYCESLGRVYRQLNAGEGVEIPPMQPTGGLRFAGRA